MTEQFTPRIEQAERRLSDGLDFYKLSMGQVALRHHPDAKVTFTLKNRGENNLTDYIDPSELERRLDAIRQAGFHEDELEYFRQQTTTDGTGERFHHEYLEFLRSVELPEVKIQRNEETGDFDIATTGPWPSVSIWETVVMSEMNELYFQGMIAKEDLSLEALYDEGDRRLSEKIAILQSRPDIKIVDFGTRRRFSAAWHHHVVGRLAAEIPDNLIGTSNPWLAKKHGIKAVGTYAHEMPMVYAALADQRTGRPLEGHSEMLRDWHDFYGSDLSTALTDTFTSDFFFEDFGRQGAHEWSGLRHDSGDPIAFGEEVIAFYEQYDVDPLTKTIVFSDGLDIDQIVELADYFAGKINVVFGWGTTLTNDLGLAANKIVMKATEVNGIGTVKLSDDEGKHTGSVDDIRRYKVGVDEFMNAGILVA